MDRRTFVRGVGMVTIAGGLAGCSQDSGSGSDGGNQNTGNGNGDSGGLSAPSEVSSYLENDETFNGSMVDETGSDSVSIKVGVEGNNGNNAYDPSAVKVSKGTTVTWTWTGNGSHNVVEQDGAFESELKSSAGTTFEQTFDEAGTVLYYCNPHKSLGMKGAIVVE